VPEDLYPTAWIAQQTCAMLADFAQGAQGEQPFFLQCSFPDPHHPFTPPGRYWDLFRPEDMPLPETFAAEGVNPPPTLACLRAQRSANPGFKPGFGAFACSAQEAREAQALHHGSLACIDDAVGQVMAQLRALGLDGNTVVMFTADHGELLGERGLMFKGGLHYDALTRVPFIWRDTAQSPDMKGSQGGRERAAPAGRVVDALAQTTDIAATYSAATLLVFLLLFVVASAAANPRIFRNAELRLRFRSAFGMNSLGIVEMNCSVNQSGFSAFHRSQFAKVYAFISSLIDSQYKC
jgi:arylsulfatase A-like enzyme